MNALEKAHARIRAIREKEVPEARGAVDALHRVSKGLLQVDLGSLDEALVLALETAEKRMSGAPPEKKLMLAASAVVRSYLQRCVMFVADTTKTSVAHLHELEGEARGLESLLAELVAQELEGLEETAANVAPEPATAANGAGA